jgi:tetratricopeptide (TPR) repeat protein
MTIVGQENLNLSIEELESWIRAGDFSSVVRSISTINRNTIPRIELVRYANIANRVNQGRIAHRLLQPIVRSDKQAKQSIVAPTEDEKIEFAEALRIMGFIGEAKKILSEIDSKRQPLADLRIAFCLMTQWKYAEAIPHLRNYLNNTDAKLYSHTIAGVNLAAALVIEREDEEALILLERLKVDTKKAGHQLLYGNCLELMAQLYIHQNRFQLADQILEEAEASSLKAQTRYSLYLRKWKAISASLQIQSVHQELESCRKLALEEMDWETLRECDLYIGFLTKNQNLLNQVYFGTPYPSYRKRILKLAGNVFLKSESYVWNQTGTEPIHEVFDVLHGKLDSAISGLETGRLMHRLLLLLTSDLYRPLSIGSAFSELFPNEQFSQAGSTNRISQIVKRLRSWFHEQGDLFSIEENSGTYHLKIQPGIGLRVPREQPQLSSHSVTWMNLVSQLPANPFSKADVIQLLGCSAASANRLLRWSISTDRCKAIGAGPQRKYRLIG